MNSSPDLMSSNGWSSSIVMTEGLFSLDSTKNAWYNANEVYAMYCSSDVWCGNGTSDYPGRSNQYEFKGKQIIKTLLDTLLEDYQMNSATTVSKN